MVATTAVVMSVARPARPAVEALTGVAGRVGVDFGAPPGFQIDEESSLDLQLGRHVAPATEASQEVPSGAGRRQILVVSDVPALCDGLAGWLTQGSPHWRVISCGSISEAVEVLRNQSTQLVIATEECVSRELVGEVASPPAHRLLVLGRTPADVEREASLVQRGASAVVPLHCPRTELVSVVARVLAGEAVIRAEALDLVVRSRNARGPTLTERQRQVLELLASGCTTAEIAQCLVVTPSTIKSHLRNIEQRHGVDGGRLGLAVNAQRILGRHQETSMISSPR